MPQQRQSRSGQDHRKIGSSSCTNHDKGPLLNKASPSFEIDEDKLYEPDWEDASDTDLDALIEISHQDD